jgi:chromosome segregation ATPase
LVERIVQASVHTVVKEEEGMADGARLLGADAAAEVSRRRAFLFEEREALAEVESRRDGTMKQLRELDRERNAVNARVNEASTALGGARDTEVDALRNTNGELRERLSELEDELIAIRCVACAGGGGGGTAVVWCVLLWGRT